MSELSGDREERTASYFEEADEVVDTIKSFRQNNGKGMTDESVGKVCIVLDKYQEEPQLLDAHLEDLVSPLLALVKGQVLKQEMDEVLMQTCKLVYHLCKVRGYKTIIKFFPHEASDLEPTLTFLHSLPPEGHVDWQVRYVILLWLSILIMIPFDLKTVDSTLAEDPSRKDVPLVDRAVELCKSFLSGPSRTKEAAAVMLSRLLNRPDISKRKTDEWDPLQTFFDWSEQVLLSEGSWEESPFLCAGVLMALAETLKQSHREDERLLRSVKALMAGLLKVKETALAGKAGSGKGNTLHRKLIMKVITRAGLAYLKPRECSWRYNRGQRITAFEGEVKQLEEKKEEEDDSESFDLPEETEEIIDVLLQGLRDRDTVVRWSAAKGVGRIGGRLPKEFANEVASAVLDTFSRRVDGDSAWHGGCLAVAELARRGLLLPERLPEVIPRVIRALTYDERRGAASVGNHVRDAACYVCWAFARAYAKEVFDTPIEVSTEAGIGLVEGEQGEDGVEGEERKTAPMYLCLAQALMVVAICDREVNCRRAASAAFQENVGRVGKFPDGIRVVTTADFFALGNRRAATTNVALDVCSTPTGRSVYLRPILLHLLMEKLRHWEKAQRELSAEAIAHLAPLFPSFLTSVAIPFLLPLTLSLDVETRHGATIGVGEAITAAAALVPDVWQRSPTKSGESTPAAPEGGSAGVAQSEEDRLKADKQKMKDEALALIKDIAPVVANIEKARLYRGKGGEVMRIAVSHFIQCVSRTRFLLLPVRIKQYLSTLMENIKHPRDDIMSAGAEAFDLFTSAYFRETYADVDVSEEKKKSFSALLDIALDTVMQFVDMLKSSENIAARRGVAIALGRLPAWLLARKCEAVVQCLCEASVVGENKDIIDAATRKFAVTSLGQVLGKVPLKYCTPAAGLTVPVVANGLSTLLAAMDDYATDDRGDVGSWVREAAMDAFCAVLKSMTTTDEETVNELLSKEVAEAFVTSVARQCCEKIDRMRQAAGRTLEFIATEADTLLHSRIPSFSLLQQVLADKDKVNDGMSDRAKASEYATDEVEFSWASPSHAFPLMAQLLSDSFFRRHILEGFCIAVGGLTESIVRQSWRSMQTVVTEWKKSQPDLLFAFALDLLLILREKRRVDRVTVPALKTVHQLLNSGLLEGLKEEQRKAEEERGQGEVAAAVEGGEGGACADTLPSSPSEYGCYLYEYVKEELKGTKDAVKIIAGVKVYTVLYGFGRICRANCLKSIMLYIGHRYPKVSTDTSCD